MKLRYHDIALIELERQVPLPFVKNGFNIRPICLDTGEDLGDIEKGQERRLTALGFGYIDYNIRESANWLQFAVISEMSLSECREKYKPLEDFRLPKNVLSSQLCARDKRIVKTQDTCPGLIYNFTCYKEYLFVSSL